MLKGSCYVFREENSNDPKPSALLKGSFQTALANFSSALGGQEQTQATDLNVGADLPAQDLLTGESSPVNHHVSLPNRVSSSKQPDNLSLGFPADEIGNVNGHIAANAPDLITVQADRWDAYSLAHSYCWKFSLLCEYRAKWCAVLTSGLSLRMLKNSTSAKSKNPKYRELQVVAQKLVQNLFFRKV